MAAIITLTTDFGVKDYFVSTIKGKILSAIENVNIIDISHSITPFNIIKASYIIKNCYYEFPKETIHIIGINTEITQKEKHIVAYIDGHYFICADNGILSLIFSENIEKKIFEITAFDKYKNSIFPTKNRFVDIAIHIAKNKNLSEICRETYQWVKFTNTEPYIDIDKKYIKGKIIYIDDFGNAVSNITKKIFNDIQSERKFEISLPSGGKNITKINHHYTIHDEEKELDKLFIGEKIALFNSANYLQISIYKGASNHTGSANTLLGLSYGQDIIIEFN